MGAPWFVYYRDLLRVVDLPSPAATVHDAVKASLKPAKELLRTVTHHCTYEEPNEPIIEYWNDGESLKLINAEDPATALEHYYEAEKAGLVKCTRARKSPKPQQSHSNPTTRNDENLKNKQQTNNTAG